VLDFGVAKAAGRAQSTKNGVLKGKVAYMAPEQIESRPLDARADVYALGVTLWEALAQRRLFKADSEVAIIYRVLNEEVPALGTISEALAPYEAVVSRAVAKDAADRYPSAREMARALDACGRVASQAEVGEWVERLAGEVLAKRAAIISQLDTVASLGPEFDATLALPGGSSSSAPPPKPSPDGEGPSSIAANTKPISYPPHAAQPIRSPEALPQESVPSHPALAQPSVKPRPLTGRGAFPVVLVGLGLFATLGLAALAKIRRAPEVEPTAHAAVLPIEAPPPETTPAQGLPPAALVAPASSPEGPGRRSPARTAPSRPAKPARGAATDPNKCMVVDANGIWHVKHECL
jgi:serine/threonine-protein kinase